MITRPDFDPALLRCFLAVAEAGSFSRAALRLGLRQSTVSQRVQRLETQAGRRLFARDTHKVALTADGDAMRELATWILDAHDQAFHHFAGVELGGVLRVGAAEDFAASRLPPVLRAFTARHKQVELELLVDRGAGLRAKLDAGELDLAALRRQPDDAAGQVIATEELIWAATEPSVVAADRPVPLVLLAASISPSLALEALRAAGRNWRIVCTSASLNGMHVAALAGLGAAVQTRRGLPAGLQEIGEAAGLPPPGSVDYVVLLSARARHNAPARALARAIAAQETAEPA